ncbi:MAG: hypothetical protein IJV31_07485, partial [Clostridia bacterium]|nr:hypothetical protein [Clostridia bacterium]
LPYGEDWVDIQNDQATIYPLLGTYTFNGKEKDYESGFHYYGSRYYSSELSIWSSTDPMADKYPYQSSYVYCGNSPIMIIDPNGEDEWEINQKGEILNQRKTNEHDKFIVKNDKNEVISESKEYNYGTVTLMARNHEVNTSKKNDKGNNIQYYVDIYKIDNIQNSNELFQFLATYANKVEWSQTLVGNDNTSYSFIGTSHIENSEVTQSVICKRNGGWRYTMKEHRHSHPYGSKPSQNDKKFAKEWKGVPLKIFYNGELHEYNENGTTYKKFRFSSTSNELFSLD